MKTFNFFEKLWEYSRTLKRVGLVLVMCLIAIPQVWAWTPIYFNGNFTENNWNGATYQINYELEESNSGHYFYPFYNGSTGDKYWRLYAQKDYVNYQLSPSSNNYVQDVGTVGYKVTSYKDWKDYNFKTTNAKVGVIAVHINQGDGNGDLTPGTWLERPTIYIWHNWGGNTSNWGNNGGSGQKSMTDKEDGTYTYDGVYSASGTNVGIEGTGPIKKYFADNATTLVGSPASGNKCRFTWNSNGYKGYDVETNNRGSLTITKLCQITYNGNGKTGGSVPSNQNDIMYNTTTTVRGNTGTLVKTNYVFTGWNANDSGTGAHYDAGTGTINPTAVTTTLYAEWQDEWNLKGSWDSWANYKGMPNVSSNTFQVTLSLAANATYEFKVVQRQASGDTYYGKTSTLFTRDNLTSVKNLSTAGATPNMQIRTDVAGDYTFTFIKDGSTSNMRVLVKYPCATAGKTLFKFTTKSSGLGTGNVCASSNVDKVSTTNDDLSALAGGTLTARSEGSNNRLKYAESAFTFDNGDRGVLRIDLDCPLQTGDVIRYINSANNASYNAYIRHTSSSTATDQLTLPGLNASIAEVVVPSGFNNKSTIYVTRGSSNGALISHIEIIRPYVITLDANTNGGQVNGNNTEIHYLLASETLELPHAIKNTYRFKGWFTTYNGSTEADNPYTPTGAATLYAQFEDCPSSDATVYKFQLKTTLSNEAAFGGVTGDYETSVCNYLSTLIGGTLTTHQYSSNLTVVSKSTFQFGSNNEYLKVDLDCALETGDKFITTIANDELCVTTSSTRDNTYKLYTGSSTTADIPAAFVGAKTLYIWRDGTNPQISYFEVYRPAKYTITYAKGSADGASGDSFTGTKIHEVDFTLSSADDAFSRSGYTYDGWSTSADGSTDDYELGGTYSTDDDITLYPHWVADAATYSITYECYSATSGCPSNLTEQTALPNPLPSAPTKNGYTFGGWYTDDTFETSAVADATLSDDVTLYSKWTCTTPTFTAQPSDETVCKGASPELSVSASANGGSLSYQWYSNTTKETAGATTLTNCTTYNYSPSTSTVGTMYYYCVVTNTTGSCSATSDIATVTVTAPTAISSHPTNVTNGVVGSASSLSVTATGTGTLTYQWYTCNSDGSSPSAISSATNASAITATLSITPASAGTTYYKCVVHSDCGSDQTSDVGSILAKNNISPSLTYASTVAVGSTINPSLSGNTGSGSVSYALNDVTPAGSLTINSSTGAVTGVTAGGTATVTVTISATESYWGNTATSGTITVPYVITHSAPSNGSYTIKVGSADAVSTNANSLSGTSITLTATPSSGYVFDHWTTSGTSVTLSNANVSPATFTMPAGNVTVNAVFKATPNVYYYKDATHFTAPSTYKNPEGNTPGGSDGDNTALTTPWTINSGSITGLTSVVATDATYDKKGTHVNAYIKLQTGGDEDDNNLIFTVTEGYEATIKMKIGGYESNPTITLKPYTTSLGSAVSYTGTVGGVATTENNFNEITWSDLEAGVYVLNTTSKTAYISEIDVQTEFVGYVITEGTHTNGSIAITDGSSAITSAAVGETVTLIATPNTGYNFTSWTIKKTEDGSDVTASVSLSGKASATFTMPAYGVTIDATFTAINYRVKWSSANHARYTIQAEGGEATDGSVYANYGQTITLATTYVDDGYHLATWGVTKTDGGAAVDMATANTFVMPAEDVTVRPIFGKYYTVTFNPNGGSTTPSAQTQTAVGQALTMPAAPTYADHTFVCWMIGGTTVAAGGSYAPPADVTAYAIWKEDCAGSTTITIGDFETSKHDKSNGKPDGRAKYLYGYTNPSSKTAANAVTMTISNGSSGAQNSGADFLVNYGSDVYVYADNTTTGGTPSSFEDITSISIKIKNYNSSNYSSFSILVGETTVANNVSLTSTENTYQTKTYNSLSNLDGIVKIVNHGSGSTNYNFYIDDIVITYGGGSSCKYVTYDGNGAAGGHTDDATAYASSATVTVLGNSFSHPGYTFTGWNTKADGSGSSFAAASTFSITKDTTLYAQWSPATLTFTGEHSNDWTDPRNWTDANSVNPACVPTINHDVILQHNTTLYGPYADDNKGHGVARSVKIDKSTEELKDIKLSIWSEASLIVAKDIQAKHVGDADWGATTHHDLEIETSILGNGALITGEVSDNDVTYKFCTKAFTVYDADRGRNYYYNQYFGIPFTSTDATKQYYNCAIYEYGVETDSWITPTDGNTLHAFRAYNLLRRNITYSDNITLNGTLNLPGKTGEVTLECGWRAKNDETTIDANKSYQDFMFANSWTAPIVIAALDDDDCTTNLVQTIYMFNSGYQPDGEKIIGDDWGQWSAFPFKSSAYMDRAVIPATQAFLVTAKSEDATLTLKYGKHVYTPALEAGGANNYPTRAPRRTREESAPTKLKMMVMNDTVVADKLYIFEREDFTNEFDNGWDGTKMFGSSSAPQLYSQQGNGKMAVAAVPEMEGMEINFIAGTDTNKYTFKFEYADEEPLYLYDRDKLEFTRIEDGSTYTFTTDDNVAHARFMLTRSKSPWVATSVEPTNDKVVDTKVRKVLINNHIYIIRGGKTYSVDGALVK